MQDAIDRPGQDPCPSAGTEHDDRSVTAIAIEIKARYAAVFAALEDL
jgi:hypothetical protein